jgi:hypothetical protein
VKPRSSADRALREQLTVVTEDRLLKTVDQPLPVAIIADNLWALTRKYDFFNTAGDIDKPDLQLAKIVVT